MKENFTEIERGVIMDRNKVCCRECEWAGRKKLGDLYCRKKSKWIRHSEDHCCPTFIKRIKGC